MERFLSGTPPLAASVLRVISPISEPPRARFVSQGNTHLLEPPGAWSAQMANSLPVDLLIALYAWLESIL